MALTASNIATCTMVTLRACVGWASRAAMTASRATSFQSVITSARAEPTKIPENITSNASEDALRYLLMTSLQSICDGDHGSALAGARSSSKTELEIGA